MLLPEEPAEEAGDGETHVKLSEIKSTTVPSGLMTITEVSCNTQDCTQTVQTVHTARYTRHIHPMPCLRVLSLLITVNLFRIFHDNSSSGNN